MGQLLSFTFIFLFLCQPYAEAAIYGDDQRVDIASLSSQWQQSAKAVAVSLPTHYLEELDNKHVFHNEYKTRQYQSEIGLCSRQNFLKQTTFGHCTAFLVHPKIMVTAAHCFLPTGKIIKENHSYCENFSFWLGYNNQQHQSPWLGSKIAKKNVVHCKQVIHAENNEHDNPTNSPMDFAILELKEEVHHIKPLKISNNGGQNAQMVTTIGHPHGLPAKFSGFSPVLNHFDTTITSFLDTLSGNSGGPAFNLEGNVVGLLISGHPTDTFKQMNKKKNKQCLRINHCDDNGENCLTDSSPDNSNLLMRSHIWKPIINQYLEEKNLKPIF